MTRPIIFLDANTIWHRRIAEALAKKVPLVAINPVSGVIPKRVAQREDGLDVVEVTLPRGWASTTAFIGQRILHRVVKRVAAQLEGTPYVVLSSPAYAPIAASLAENFPIVSYTADDYRGYSGWGGDRVKENERRIHALASLSVFVSSALRDRAINEFGLMRARTLVCPNATEARFAQRDVPMPEELRDRPRPIVGVLGGLSERLDLDLVAQVAALPSVGTFLVAGPVDETILDLYPVLRNSSVVITGRLPHSDMHRYALTMDAGLIPYARTQLNYCCSPMRLFDHTVTGVSIFAAAGCHQIDNGTFDNVVVAEGHVIAGKLELALRQGLGMRQFAPEGYFWDDRAKLLIDALERIGSCENAGRSDC